MAGFRRKNKGNSEDNRQKVSKGSLKKSLRLFKYIRPYMRTFVVGLVFLILSSLASMVFPYLSGMLVDASNGDFQEINSIALALLGIFFLNAVFSFFRIYLMYSYRYMSSHS